jgi:hypothetical protein
MGSLFYFNLKIYSKKVLFNNVIAIPIHREKQSHLFIVTIHASLNSGLSLISSLTNSASFLDL